MKKTLTILALFLVLPSCSLWESALIAAMTPDEPTYHDGYGPGESHFGQSTLHMNHKVVGRAATLSRRLRTRLGNR
jgi:hypothetical protein